MRSDERRLRRPSTSEKWQSSRKSQMQTWAFDPAFPQSIIVEEVQQSTQGILHTKSTVRECDRGDSTCVLTTGVHDQSLSIAFIFSAMSLIDSDNLFRDEGRHPSPSTTTGKTFSLTPDCRESAEAQSSSPTVALIRPEVLSIWHIFSGNRILVPNGCSLFLGLF